MNLIQNNGRSSRSVQVCIKIAVSAWMLSLVFRGIFLSDILRHTDVDQIIVRTVLGLLLSVFLVYSIWNVEKLLNTFREKDCKQSFLYAIYYAASVALCFNPMDNAYNEVTAFHRVIGIGILDNTDVSKRINDFNLWFILFAVSFVLFYLFINDLQQQKKTEDAKKVEMFLDHYMILANCILVLRGISFFQKETNASEFPFVACFVLLIALAAQLYIFLKIDRFISANDFGKIGMIGAAAALSLSIVLFDGIKETEFLCTMVVCTAVMLLLCVVARKTIDRVWLVAGLSAGVLVFFQSAAANVHLYRNAAYSQSIWGILL